MASITALVIKALLARLIFAIHGFVAIWRVTDVLKDTRYWFLAGSIGLLLFEGLTSICLRRGEEMKWFSPSVFLYLSSVVPPIWFLELDMAYKRIELGENYNATDVKHEKLSTIIDGFDIPIILTTDLWARVLEQVLMVILIIGRWLLPKGELTRDQLSQLLLVYIGMAADIVELFEAFKEDVVNRNLELTFIILGLWSWSLLQFTLVLTATKARKPRVATDRRRRRRRSSTGKRKCCECCGTDIWGIMTTIILQDGPFLCLRMTLIFYYGVVSYLNIFFTCKNTLVTLLQIYRLFVLCCEKSTEMEPEMVPLENGHFDKASESESKTLQPLTKNVIV